MQLHDALLQALSLLDELGTPAALLGGIAVSVWTEPRFTRDVDLAVAVGSDSDAERLIYQLQQRGYRVLATVEQTATARLATARMLPPGESQDGLIVDLLFCSSGIEREIVDAAMSLDIGASAPVKVVRVGHLVALKLLSHDPRTRPQDGVDLRALREAFDDEEIERARKAVALIVERGFDRGRDLSALLEAFLAPSA
jgi:predicted nucleotidyltransferase